MNEYSAAELTDTSKPQKIIDTVERVGDEIQRRRRDVEQEIRDHPIRSLAIALGTGYLLARLLD